jgi:hypothetical protein
MQRQVEGVSTASAASRTRSTTTTVSRAAAGCAWSTAAGQLPPMASSCRIRCSYRPRRVRRTLSGLQLMTTGSSVGTAGARKGAAGGPGCRAGADIGGCVWLACGLWVRPPTAARSEGSLDPAAPTRLAAAAAGPTGARGLGGLICTAESAAATSGSGAGGCWGKPAMACSTCRPQQQGCGSVHDTSCRWHPANPDPCHSLHPQYY